ncbi:MAG TPA: SRPBCC domain-containing protein [Solirubrobacteraceae bacterium]|nr:SRPBCC domain-containing protein [Solirubrobacteraceae bacterium]
MPIHGRHIEQSLQIAAPPERVWNALTQPGELNRWETTEAHLDLRTGGDFLYVFAYGPPRPGTFLALDPPRRMVQLNFVYNGDRNFRYINALTLTGTPEGTVVDVLVEGFGDDEVERWLCESMDLGWEGDLQLLKIWIEEGRDARPDIWPGLYLGIAYLSAPTGGIKVREVFPGTPANEAGIAPGDLLTALGGEPISDFRGFRSLLGQYEIGDTTSICGLRDAVPFTTEISFGDAFAAQTAPGKEPARTASLAGDATG